MSRKTNWNAHTPEQRRARNREILEFANAGWSPAKIAEEYDLHPGTIKMILAEMRKEQRPAPPPAPPRPHLISYMGTAFIHPAYTPYIPPPAIIDTTSHGGTFGVPFPGERWRK